MLTLLASGVLLADIDPKEVEAMKEAAKNTHWRPLGIETPALLGAIFVLSLILFTWAFFIRRRPKHSRGSLVVHRSKNAEAVSADGRRRRRKRRPEHPDNWGRNPTLGETGGLPPVRPPEDSIPPESSSSAT